MLNNRTILITRDLTKNQELQRQIVQLGGKCIVLPMIQISPPDDWSDADDALKSLDLFDWIIFSSINGVRSFFQRARQKNIDRFKGKIAAVGSKTKKMIEESGWQVDLIPQIFSAAGILQSFKQIEVKNKHILLPTSDISRQELSQGLLAQGAIVRNVVTYKTECVPFEASNRIADILDKEKIDAILFFSPSAVHCFRKNIHADMLARIVNRQIVIGAVGETTAEAIQKAGLKTHVVPDQSTQEKLLMAVIEYFNDKMEKVDA